jgi:hypothetical protein
MLPMGPQRERKKERKEKEKGGPVYQRCGVWDSAAAGLTEALEVLSSVYQEIRDSS